MRAALVVVLCAGCNAISGASDFEKVGFDDAAVDASTETILDTGSSEDTAVADGVADATADAADTKPCVACGDATCVDLTSDDAHCGACGNRCQTLTRCSSGACGWEALLAAVNAIRSAPRPCGGSVRPAVAPLTWDDRLEAAALRYAKDAAANNWDVGELTGVGSDGSSVGARVTAAGYKWTAAYQGHGVSDGTESPKQLIETFASVPANCQELMRADYVHFGFAAAPGMRYPVYLAMVFARP